MRWIIDAEASTGGIRLKAVSLKGDLQTLWVEAEYKGYVAPRIGADALRDRLCEHPKVEGAHVERWLKPPFYREVQDIVVFRTRDPRAVGDVLGRVEMLGLGSRINTYPGLLPRTLSDLGIPLCTMVDDALNPLESVEDPFYAPPKIRWVRVSLEAWFGETLSPLIKPTHARIEAFDGSLYRVSIGGLEDVLESLEPTIVMYRGPHRGIIYRASRAVGAIPMIIDTVDLGIHGYIEWCRLSYMPLRYVASQSIGRVLTTIEALEAFRKRYIVPHRGVGFWEPPRKVRDLATADRGGLVMKPRPGVYFDVVQIDFSSLYPSIISRYNISPETVNDPSCRRAIEVPEAGHRICLDRRGLVSSVIGKIVARREALRACGPLDPGVADQRQTALKWILVASFGYLGYRNSRFGRIDSYECVTAYARDTAWRAIDSIASRGGRVIHYIVDSIFVAVDRLDDSTALEILNLIEGSTGFKAKVEARYSWLIIPPAGSGGEDGASNRYVGRFQGGGLKVKGLDPVRRDTPKLVRDAWMDALTILEKADTPDRLLEAVDEAAEVVEAYRRRIRLGDVDPRDLVVARRSGSGLGYVHVIRGPRRFYMAHKFRGYSANYYMGRLDRILEFLNYIKRSIGRNRQQYSGVLGG